MRKCNFDHHLTQGCDRKTRIFNTNQWESCVPKTCSTELYLFISKHIPVKCNFFPQHNFLDFCSCTDAYLPRGGLDIDSAPPAGEGTFHSKEEAALCVWFLGLLWACGDERRGEGTVIENLVQFSCVLYCARNAEWNAMGVHSSQL